MPIDLQRRALIKGLTLLPMGWGLLQGLASAAVVLDSAAEPAISDKTMASFLALSEVLTGFKHLNAYIGKFYYQDLSLQYSEQAMRHMIQIHQANQQTSLSATEKKLNEQLKSDPSMRTLANEIIQTWYTGTLKKLTVDKNIRASIYFSGLMWTCMGTSARGGVWWPLE